MLNIKDYLSETAAKNGLVLDGLHFPGCALDPKKIKAIMIDEAPPKKPNDGFFSQSPKSSYVRTTLGLFRLADIDVTSVQDILDMGIYITTTLKAPRDKAKPLKADEIKAHIPLLEEELALFPNLKMIMLMGGTAIKAREKRDTCGQCI